jgi:hypothetical protein
VNKPEISEIHDFLSEEIRATLSEWIESRRLGDFVRENFAFGKLEGLRAVHSKIEQIRSEPNEWRAK